MKCKGVGKSEVKSRLKVLSLDECVYNQMPGGGGLTNFTSIYSENFIL